MPEKKKLTGMASPGSKERLRGQVKLIEETRVTRKMLGLLSHSRDEPLSRLRALRLSLWDTLELAEEASGVDTTVWWRAERGVVPSLENALAMARALEVRIEDIWELEAGK